MDLARSPYAAHVFVCVNDRQGVRKSCADGRSVEVKEALKQAVAARGWKPRVRVSHCGCMGLCEAGPNVIVYPAGTWFRGVTPADLDAILAEVARALG